MNNPIYKVETKRGAPMGRHCIHGISDSWYRFRVRKVELSASGYDKGGAYWGHGGPGPLFVAWADCEPRHADLFPRLFFRAKDRNTAKAHVLENYPNATFYR